MLVIVSVSIAQPIEVEIIKNPALQELKRLEVLNSPYRETNLSITPDGRFLYFMSPRGGLPWSVADYTEFRGQSQYDGDIWFSRKINGNWMPPEHLPSTINTPNLELSTSVIQGYHLFFGLNIFISTLRFIASLLIAFGGAFGLDSPK